MEATTQTPLHALQNLGPKSAEVLARVGLRTYGDLQQCGALHAYARVKAAGLNVSLNLLYAMVASLSNRHWTEITREEKVRLLHELDALYELAED